MLVYQTLPTFEAFEASANRQAQKRRPFLFCDGHFPWSILFGFHGSRGWIFGPFKSWKSVGQIQDSKIGGSLGESSPGH